MKMKLKKLLCLSLAGMMALSLAACGGKDTADETPGPDAAGTPAVPETPAVSDAPEPLDTLPVLETPAVSDAPESSETPTVPETPDVSEPPEPAGHEPPTTEEARSYISLEIDGDVSYVEEPITLSEFEGPRTINGYSVLSQETRLTISNLAGAEDNCYIRIDLMFYEKEADRGNWPFPGDFYLTNEGEIEQSMGVDDNALKLRPGESVTFSLPSFSSRGYPLAFLTLTLDYPDFEKSWWEEWHFLVDG